MINYKQAIQTASLAMFLVVSNATSCTQKLSQGNELFGIWELKHHEINVLGNGQPLTVEDLSDYGFDPEDYDIAEGSVFEFKPNGVFISESPTAAEPVTGTWSWGSKQKSLVIANDLLSSFEVLSLTDEKAVFKLVEVAEMPDGLTLRAEFLFGFAKQKTATAQLD